MAICLWYDNQAEEAVNFYTEIFKDSQIIKVSRFGKEGFEIHGKEEGMAMTVSFQLNGMNFLALNGGPKFKFSDAISVVVYCETQKEIDHYWSSLTEEGKEGPCGWLKDKYGVSWQITPSILPKYLTDQNANKRNRVEKCAFGMKKFEIARLQKAYDGK